MIELRALGAAEILTSSATITPSQDIVFAAGLYVVVQRGKPISRAALASLLWPRAGLQSRTHRLRQTIQQMKKLGIVLTADRTTVRLASDAAVSDFDSLTDAESKLRNELSEFLPGYIPRCSETFRDWVDARRGEVHADITRVLIRELERLRRQADWSAVERMAMRCLALDPFNEAAVLAQAEAAAMRGGKRAAVSILDHYIAEVGNPASELRLPATILRRRVIERIPDSTPLLNPDPPFVGREAEMARLVKGLDGARGGNGSVALIVGEPGIGKSRLSAEIARFAELQGARVQRAKCRRTDVDRPLSLFVDIVPHLREMPGALGCSPETFTWLKRLTEFEHRPDETTKPLDSEIWFQNVRGALFDLLDSVADERCLVIVIDDIQWLDAPSASVLHRIEEWCRGRRVFLIINSHPTKSAFLAGSERNRTDAITLSGLAGGASAALLRSILPGSVVDPESEFLDWCLSVAEGNPFFLQELAHQWLETGHRYEAPPSVSRVLQERLSRLREEALRVLQTSAVLGDLATVDRAIQVLEYQPHLLISAVEELSKAGMLKTRVEGRDSPPGELQPRHDFLASAAIARLTPVSLAFIHRRAADVLETETPKAAMPTALLWACANHAHSAGDRKRALALRLTCAQHLVDLGLLEEACKRYEDSLTQCASDADRLAVLSPMSQALQLNGRWERSKEALRTCIRIASNAADAVSRNEFEVQLLHAKYRSTLDFVSLLQEALPWVKNRDALPRHRISAGIVALKLASDVGPASILDEIHSEIAPLLKLDDVDLPSRLEAEIIYLAMRGNAAVDVSLLDHFVDITRSLHGEIAYSNALLTASSACRLCALDEDALRFAETAFHHASTHNLRARLPVIKLLEARLHFATGNLVEARAVISSEKLYPIAEDDSHTRFEWDLRDARVAVEEGNLIRAKNLLVRIGPIPTSFSANRRASCLAISVRFHLASDAQDEIIRPLVLELEEVHAVNRDIANQDYEAHALFLGLCRIGEQTRALKMLTDYVMVFRRNPRRLPTNIITCMQINSSTDKGPPEEKRAEI